MNTNELTQAIAAEDFAVDRFVQLVFREEGIRDEVINQMVINPDIMVYYHCYYVISKASQEKPDLFISHWQTFASLLKHKNSYHRDFALTILANLTQVDQDDLFSEIYSAYFEHIYDQKFMTGKCCVQNSLKIIKNKPELRDAIIALLIDMDNQSPYTDKQIALLNCDVLEILDQVYAEVSNKKGTDEFIKRCTQSISPKTKHKAKELVIKYGL